MAREMQPGVGIQTLCGCQTQRCFMKFIQFKIVIGFVGRFWIRKLADVHVAHMYIDSGNPK